MNRLLKKLDKEDKETMQKYLNQQDVLRYPQNVNMKSIIQATLEKDINKPEEQKYNSQLNTQNNLKNQGVLKKNRIKCYKQINQDLLEEEKRRQRQQFKLMKEKEKPIPDQNYLIKNAKELLSNITEVNKKLLSSINENNVESDSEEKTPAQKNSNLTTQLPNNIETLYFFGANYINNKNLFIYHKKDRWISYPNSDCIIVDKYVDDITSSIDLKKNQTILNMHKNKSYITSIKLSPNGNIIYCITEDNYIIFYKYDIQKLNFLYISEHKVPCKQKVNDFLVEPNEIFCMIIYDFFKLLIIDYVNNNIINDTIVQYLNENDFKGITLNNYTDHKIEFCLFSNNTHKLYEFQITKEFNLIEKNFKNQLIFDSNINCINYLPPISSIALLCILVACDDKSLYLINADTNRIIQKYTFKFNVNNIVCTLFYINLFTENKIIYHKIKNPREMDNNKVGEELFENEDKEIIHESNIISSDVDLYDVLGSALICTEDGKLYYDYYPEKKKIQLYNFSQNENHITHCTILNNYNINKRNKNTYFIVLSYSNFYIKIYGIPSYDILYEFKEKCEISYLINVPNKTQFCAFYKDSTMKYFEVNNKIKSSDTINLTKIIGVEEFEPDNFIKYAIFYPYSNYCLCVDAIKNNLFLLTIESAIPLYIKSKQIPGIHIDTLNSIVLNKIEPFISFMVTNNNNEIFVYDRKYALLFGNEINDNETPVYQKKDYFNISKILKEEKESNDNEDDIKKNLNECYYGLINKKGNEKHFLYVFNYKYNSLILRDTKSRNILDVIRLNIPIYSLKFQNNVQDNVIILSKNGISKLNIYDIINDVKKYNGLEWMSLIRKKLNNIKDGVIENDIILSEDEKIFIFTNDNCFNSYIITK